MHANKFGWNSDERRVRWSQKFLCQSYLQFNEWLCHGILLSSVGNIINSHHFWNIANSCGSNVWQTTLLHAGSRLYGVRVIGYSVAYAGVACIMRVEALIYSTRQCIISCLLLPSSLGGCQEIHIFKAWTPQISNWYREEYLESECFM